MQWKHVIVGAGEVGSSLFKVIGGTLHDPYKQMIAEGKFSVLHICIPYTKDFLKQVKAYQLKFKPKITLIHSSVPVGTSSKLRAVHSPIRGVHPEIDKGIRTFVKYFGGKQAKTAAKFFSDIGIQVFTTPKSETTESLKLWDTTQYGMAIALNKYIKKWCERRGLDFDIIYTHANQSYNAGYSEFGRHEVMRPWLTYMPGKIGGHCVRQNAKLLGIKSIISLLDKSL